MGFAAVEEVDLGGEPGGCCCCWFIVGGGGIGDRDWWESAEGGRCFGGVEDVVLDSAEEREGVREVGVEEREEAGAWIGMVVDGGCGGHFDGLVCM